MPNTVGKLANLIHGSLIVSTTKNSETIHPVTAARFVAHGWAVYGCNCRGKRTLTITEAGRARYSEGLQAGQPAKGAQS